MKALIVHAHENPDSFCSAIASHTDEVLTQLGIQVTISDLYKMNFDPVGSKKDFTSLSDAPYYKYPLEQWNASQNDLFNNELKQEIEKLNHADLLIFNFPLWWYSTPAILKGWVDRVMAYGVAYGAGCENKFKDRQAMVSITTGSPKKPNDDKDLDRILENITAGILQYVGFDLIPSFISYGVSRISQVEREHLLVDFKEHLQKYVKTA